MHEKKPFYITTPIYYPSAKLQLKIQQKAEEAGVTPIEYTDKIVAGFQNLWKRLSISNDDFIRTTQKRHERVVQEIFRRIYAKGDIYKGEYKGLYCTPCESYWTEHQLDENGCCPDCHRPVQEVAEEAYFFKMSKYQDRVLQYIEDHPDFIQPVSRRNEMINFIKQGLDDLCISRTSFNWGIPVPIDPKHVIYVWFDALTNYLTPIGYLDLDLPLPKKVYGHGWLIVDGDKMSKSKGNVVDPIGLIDEFGADAIRYFLLREINLGQDGNFSRDALIGRINSDLANDLGNLLHRTLSMTLKFQGGVVKAPAGESDVDRSLKEDARETVAFFERNMEDMQLSLTIKKVWAFISRANKYIDETAPWALAKDPAKEQELANVLYNLTEALRVISVLISPFMPTTAVRIWQQLGLAQDFASVRTEDIEQWGGVPAGLHVGTPEQLFPRIEVEKEEQPAKQPKANKQKKEKKADKKDDSGEVTFDEFSKLQLRVAKVLAAEKIPETDKLLKLKVDLGSEQRELVSGIANHYEPSELIGKNVVMVANLKPAKIRGVVSHGMVLAASQGDDLKVVSVDMPVGAVVK